MNDNKHIDIDSIAETIKSDLYAYSKEIQRKFEEGADKIAIETIRNLSSDSPTKRGVFSKGWKKSKQKTDGVITIIISNKEYRLTHLLNDGHIMPQGGRSKAFRLITRNEIIAKGKFYKLVGDIIVKH